MLKPDHYVAVLIPRHHLQKTDWFNLLFDLYFPKNLMVQFLVDLFYKEKRLDSLTIMETVKLDD
ncbi:MAG: hypothetical protein CL914_11670 [Deltaproteobacteria bacterium]|nr:hypothetical protein [Deltaproteobacteria bacterium]